MNGGRATRPAAIRRPAPPARPGRTLRASDGSASTSASVEQRRDVVLAARRPARRSRRARRRRQRAQRAMEGGAVRRRDRARSPRPGSTGAPPGARAQAREGRQRAEGVLALLDAADGQHDRAVAPVPGARASRTGVARHARKRAHVDAVADERRGRRRSVLRTSRGRSSLTVRQRSASRIERAWQRSEVRILEGLDVMDRAHQRTAGPRARAASSPLARQAVLARDERSCAPARARSGRTPARGAQRDQRRRRGGRGRAGTRRRRARSGRKKPRPSLSSA